jgi:cholesterol oxidase
MTMLATDPAKLRNDYDVLIIGSGYGGAITAARLGVANQRAQKMLHIAILERGDEHVTGAFPGTALEFAGQVRTNDNPLGIFEFVASPDFFVVQGNGLGGTSLANGNVLLIPQREVFETYWPTTIAQEQPFPLGPYYERVLAMLGAVPYASQVSLPKVAAFETVAKSAGSQLHALNLAVTTEPRVTRYGIPRQPCVNCGSCISGCNYEAKNTLDKNYLPMAKHFGVDMFTRMEVRQIQKLPEGGWLLTVNQRRGQKGTEITTRNVRTKKLVLAAGCLGTTGLLLRSQSRPNRLLFSPQLGQHFSGNGDFFALAYNTDHLFDFNGWTSGTDQRFHVKSGPTITTYFRVAAEKLTDRMTFEEASMPAPFVETMRNAAFLAAAGQPWKFLDSPSKVTRWLEDRYRNNTGAMNSSILYLGMGFDEAAGTIVLEGGEPRIVWPNAAEDPVFRRLREVSARGTAALGGAELANPLMQFNLPAQRIPITGHPIGGCATADSIDKGVVDDRGRVYDPEGGFHEGLFVVDGSVLPASLGVNVLLTIGAFAERAAEFMRQDFGLAPFDPVVEGNDRA